MLNFILQNLDSTADVPHIDPQIPIEAVEGQY